MYIYKPETKEEAANTRKIAIGFVIFIGLAVLAFTARIFGLF